MSVSPLSVRFKSSSTTSNPPRITWTVTPTAPLYLKQLSIVSSSDVVGDCVVGYITTGTPPHNGQPAVPSPCTLAASPTKFATLLSECQTNGLIENLSYDNDVDLNAHNLSSQPALLSATLLIASSSETLIGQVKTMNETNVQILDVLTDVKELLKQREYRTSDVAPKKAV